MLVYLFQKSKISIIKNKVEIKSNKIGPIVSQKKKTTVGPTKTPIVHKTSKKLV